MWSHKLVVYKIHLFAINRVTETYKAMTPEKNHYELQREKNGFPTNLLNIIITEGVGVDILMCFTQNESSANERDSINLTLWPN